MSEIIHPKKEQESRVVGMAPEMIDRLSRLRDQIGFILNHPQPTNFSGPSKPWTDLSDRYDIIIGDFGIKDLSVKAPFKSVPSPWPSISLPAPTLLPSSSPPSPGIPRLSADD